MNARYRLAQGFGLLVGVMLITSVPGCDDFFSNISGKCPKNLTNVECKDYANSLLDGGSTGGVDAGPCGGECSGATPVCDTGSNSCVACVQNTDCGDATASRCNASNSCVACTEDADCGHVDGLPRCISGTCKACRIESEAADCDGKFCDGATNSCTAIAQGLGDACDACTADADCQAGRRCLAQSFDATSLGTFCMLHAGGGCGDTVAARRPYRNKVMATSVDGEAAEYCFPPTSTTCQGIADTQSKACTMDSECGVMGEDDGYCPPGGTGGGFCSYTCGGDLDCRQDLSCGGTPAHCRPTT